MATRCLGSNCIQLGGARVFAYQIENFAVLFNIKFHERNLSFFLVSFDVIH